MPALSGSCGPSFHVCLMIPSGIISWPDCPESHSTADAGGGCPGAYHKLQRQRRHRSEVTLILSC